MNKAAFIDKDGTLVYDVPYNVDPLLIRFQEGAFAALKMLKEQGYLLVMISNQSGVAYGYFSEEALEAVKDAIQSALRNVGVQFDGFYFCPHHPDGIVNQYAIRCGCRKPEPGLILKAAEDLRIDCSQSWMIGDILNDVEAGNRAGCRTIMVNNGYETEWVRNAYREPDYTVSTIIEAASIILANKAYVEHRN